MATWILLCPEGEYEKSYGRIPEVVPSQVVAACLECFKEVLKARKLGRVCVEFHRLGLNELRLKCIFLVKGCVVYRLKCRRSRRQRRKIPKEDRRGSRSTVCVLAPKSEVREPRGQVPLNPAPCQSVLYSPRKCVPREVIEDISTTMEL